ncbi:MAG TPA: alanine--tRNA ligase [Clostridiaceae bacterium]|nr:alanine--tRNA ligase [Clostridiaceae bacterium]
MKPLGLNEIRSKFLEFFTSKEHLVIPSFSLIPQNDPSILLINAGMTPLKPYFTGAEKPPALRVATCQKCVRTQDIDIVGQTARHATFFEMLGNFSFGDYFKDDAITWAWEFCTEVLEMPSEKLYATVYLDDDEAYDIWHKKIGLPHEKIFRFGKEDNFWEHGTGPCGPCSELFFDRGPEHGCGDPNCTVGCECDRYIEFWNLVFTQFEKDEAGNYIPLKQKNIDTGAGLERLASIMQDVGSIFEVDTVHAVLEAVCKIANVEYGQNEENDVAIRVITDHARSTVFMISDGVEPSNERRGYVLRRLIRRAARYGRKLGISGLFLTDLAKIVIQQSCDAYPELAEREAQILRVLTREEKAFGTTIKQGSMILADYLEKSKAEGHSGLSGEQVFMLHDTFGFPVDLTREIAAEQNLNIDLDGFNELMQEQKARARKATLANTDSAWDANALPDSVKIDSPTEFLGYDQLEIETELLYLLQNTDNGLVTIEKAKEGDQVIIITDRTPFYAESGGQVGDQGLMENAQTKIVITNTTRNGDGIYLHQGEIVAGELCVGDSISLTVDRDKRLATERNHTGTHILHQALHQVLGEHVDQAGSLVAPDRLRFDFKHHQPVTAAELDQIEDISNQIVLQDMPVTTEIMDLEQAKAGGARALFGEKYGDRVRVVTIGDFSQELCGGTHLKHSSQIGSIRILSETGTAAGVRRIEAVTGAAAYQHAIRDAALIQEISEQLKAQPNNLLAKIEQLQAGQKELEKELEKARNKQAANIAEELINQAESVGDFKVVLGKISNADAEQLRQTGDQIRNNFKEESAVIALVSESPDKVIWMIMATQQAVSAGVHAGNLIREAAKITGGGGGGRPDMAQAGGKKPEKIADALAYLKDKIGEL